MKSKIFHAFLWIFIIVILGMAGYQCRNLRGYVILSGSMEPMIPTGSVVVVDTADRDVFPGDVATFSRHGDLVTHRILSKTEDGYQTKGDANTDPDTGTISAEDIRGKVLFHIPVIGYGMVWFKNHLFMGVGFCLLLILLISCFPEHKSDTKNQKERKRKRKQGELKLTKKKVVTFFAVSALCGAMAIGSSMAYLTDHDSVTNKFSVGKVDIEGQEPNYTPDPDGKTNNILPTQVIKKDPQIKNVGKNDAYVYIDVSIPIAKVITVDAAGNRLNGGVAKDTELFTQNNVSKKWTLMYNKRVGDNMVYTYSYNEILAPGKTTDPVFNSLTAANIIEGQLDGKDLNVPVRYYAIQELNTGEGTTIPQKAASAWKKYELQNQGQDGQITTPQSDSTNDKEVTIVDGNGNAVQNDTEDTTADDVQTEPEEAADTTLS